MTEGMTQREERDHERRILANIAEKISPRSLVSIISSKPGKKKKVVIPFDDGWRREKESMRDKVLESPGKRGLNIKDVVDMLTSGKKEIDRLHEELSRPKRRVEEQAYLFSVTEKNLLDRVEKSLTEQLVLKNKMKGEEKETTQLKVTVASLQIEIEDLKFDADNSSDAHAQVLEKLRADMKREREQEQQQSQQLNEQSQSRIEELELDSESCHRAIDKLLSEDRNTSTRNLEAARQMNSNYQRTREREIEATSCLERLRRDSSEAILKKDAELLRNRSAAASVQSKLNTADMLAKDLLREKEYLTSEIAGAAAIVDNLETELETTTNKLSKTERAGKDAWAERDDLSVQLRGCRRKLLRLNAVVAEIKQKELWERMEAQLQGGSDVSKVEETGDLYKELKACQAELKALRASGG